MKFKLPSGRVVEIEREAIGADVEKAFSIAGVNAGNPATYAMALFAQVANVEGSAEGAPVLYEDVRAYPHQDIMAILAWANGGADALIKSGIEVITAAPGAGVPL